MTVESITNFPSHFSSPFTLHNSQQLHEFLETFLDENGILKKNLSLPPLGSAELARLDKLFSNPLKIVDKKGQPLFDTTVQGFFDLSRLKLVGSSVFYVLGSDYIEKLFGCTLDGSLKAEIDREWSQYCDIDLRGKVSSIKELHNSGDFMLDTLHKFYPEYTPYEHKQNSFMNFLFDAESKSFYSFTLGDRERNKIDIVFYIAQPREHLCLKDALHIQNINGVWTAVSDYHYPAQAIFDKLRNVIHIDDIASVDWQGCMTLLAAKFLKRSKISLEDEIALRQKIAALSPQALVHHLKLTIRSHYNQDNSALLNLALNIINYDIPNKDIIWKLTFENARLDGETALSHACLTQGLKAYDIKKVFQAYFRYVWSEEDAPDVSRAALELMDLPPLIFTPQEKIALLDAAGRLIDVSVYKRQLSLAIALIENRSKEWLQALRKADPSELCKGALIGRLGSLLQEKSFNQVRLILQEPASKEHLQDKWDFYLEQIASQELAKPLIYDILLLAINHGRYDLSPSLIKLIGIDAKGMPHLLKTALADHEDKILEGLPPPEQWNLALGLSYLGIPGKHLESLSSYWEGLEFTQDNDAHVKTLLAEKKIRPSGTAFERWIFHPTGAWLAYAKKLGLSFSQELVEKLLRHHLKNGNLEQASLAFSFGKNYALDSSLFNSYLILAFEKKSHRIEALSLVDEITEEAWDVILSHITEEDELALRDKVWGLRKSHIEALFAIPTSQAFEVIEKYPQAPFSFLKKSWPSITDKKRIFKWETWFQNLSKEEIRDLIDLLNSIDSKEALEKSSGLIQYNRLPFNHELWRARIIAHFHELPIEIKVFIYRGLRTLDSPELTGEKGLTFFIGLPCPDRSIPLLKELLKTPLPSQIPLIEKSLLDLSRWSEKDILFSFQEVFIAALSVVSHKNLALALENYLKAASHLEWIERDLEIIIMFANKMFETVPLSLPKEREIFEAIAGLIIPVLTQYENLTSFNIKLYDLLLGLSLQSCRRHSQFPDMVVVKGTRNSVVEKILTLKETAVSLPVFYKTSLKEAERLHNFQFLVYKKILELRKSSFSKNMLNYLFFNISDKMYKQCPSYPLLAEVLDMFIKLTPPSGENQFKTQLEYNSFIYQRADEIKLLDLFPEKSLAWRLYTHSKYWNIPSTEVALTECELISKKLETSPKQQIDSVIKEVIRVADMDTPETSFRAAMLLANFQSTIVEYERFQISKLYAKLIEKLEISFNHIHDNFYFFEYLASALFSDEKPFGVIPSSLLIDEHFKVSKKFIETLLLIKKKQAHNFPGVKIIAPLLDFLKLALRSNIFKQRYGEYLSLINLLLENSKVEFLNAQDSDIHNLFFDAIVTWDPVEPISLSDEKERLDTLHYFFVLIDTTDIGEVFISFALKQILAISKIFKNHQDQRGKFKKFL